MTNAVLVISLTTVCFLAAILSLSISKAANGRLMGLCAVVAIASGIFCYGYGYSYLDGFSASTVLKALLAVCRMFGGVNDFSTIRTAPLFDHGAVTTLFWVGHFLAFYLMASAAIAVLGKRMMKRLRTTMLRWGDLCLIYDASPDTLRLAGDRRRGRSAVLVTEHTDESLSALADSQGAVVFPGGRNLCADERFLQGIGVKGDRRPVDVYCIGSDPGRNLRYAEALLPALQARNVSPNVTSLFLLGVSEDRAARLLAQGDRYGYGTLFACNQYELIARLVVEKRPPWDFLSFDADGRARGDFRVAVVGFGQMGTAMLRQWIVNGQFEGSAFHAEVFDRRMEDLRGFAEACYPALLKAYDITLHAADADSALFYRRLAENTPNVIALCTSSRKQNAELADNLHRLYGNRPDRPCVVQCTPDAVLIDDVEYRLDSVDVRSMDRTAMVLNHVYCGGPSPEADWRICDPFSRASCRAAVDFFPAFLKAANVSRADVLAGKWPPAPQVLDNLSRAEHLRWCAFYLAMGYTPMSDEEFSRRCEMYRKGTLKRIAKNTEGLTHACLAPWEALDALSERENAVTGGSVDYKALDTNNVLAIPDILRQV